MMGVGRKGDVMDMWSDLEGDFAAEREIADFGTPAPRTFEERCGKCNGTGRWGYYRSRACFACGGKGLVTYRTSSEDRAKARDRVARKKGEAAQAWQETNPAAWAWIVAKAPKFGFAAAMQEAVRKYGHLTDNQLATVERLRGADAEREAKWAQEREARAAAAPAIDVSRIVQAIGAALASGIKRPVLRLAEFKFSPAPVTGRNAGAIYVKSVGGDYLGKVADGKFMRAFGTCDDARAAEIVAAAADPEAAAVAYGKRFGQCACCGRELSNPESIERGIGPICAERFGW
jgi:hypothetical protein